VIKLSEETSEEANVLARQVFCSILAFLKLHRLLITELIAALGDVFYSNYHADKVIERRFKAHPKWGSRDRKLFAESLYELVRWWRWYWHLAGLPANECLQKEFLTEEHVWQVWAAYWLDKKGDLPEWGNWGGLNADKVRQRKQREVAPAIRASVPDWLFQRGEQEFGSEWPAILAALNEPADVYLRANTLRITAAALQDKLGAEEIETELVSGLEAALKLPVRKNVFSTQAFRDGLFEVQDAGSQRIAPFLEVTPGMRVIDGCAGAGGKALHLAALMRNKGKIIALDVHEWKLNELRKRAARNGADNVESRVIEGTTTIKRLAGSADRVLLDVPCSGMGVLRRNPDAKWKLSEEEITRLQALQAEILQSYARMVKPGGKLVYATCSLLPSENEKQIEAFLINQNGDWSLDAELKLRPDLDGTDGFYAARLTRKAEKAQAVTATES
jgi:16S rRNA (cytosine967-C5)-methyltransferase